MELFHGSNVVADSPKIIVDGYYKDFGYGFYCTSLEKTSQTLGVSETTWACCKYL